MEDCLTEGESIVFIELTLHCGFWLLGNYYARPEAMQSWSGKNLLSTAACSADLIRSPLPPVALAIIGDSIPEGSR